MTDGANDVRDGFRFLGGHPALDLTATLAGRRKPTTTERLAAPTDLARWLVAAGFAGDRPAADEADLQAAKALREAIHALALACAQARPLPDTAAAVLNAAAARPAAAPVLQPDGGMRLSGSTAALLSHLARGGVALISGQEPGVIRRCEGGTCAILFLDVSRAGRRRWCSMAGCGNRAKAAAHRRRERGEGE